MNDTSTTSSNQWAIIAILALTIVKGVLWSAAIPIWQAPDEPSHFSVVQFIAEFGRLPGPKDDAKVSEEVRQSAKLLDLWRIAFHPAERPVFSVGMEGADEAAIRDTPWKSRITPSNMSSTALHLPPLYYIPCAGAYRLVYGGDILVRLYAVRQISVILAVVTVWLAYRTTRLVFPTNVTMQVTIPILVSFHPMFTFLGAVVNTDIMLIMLSSWATHLLLLVIHSGFTAKRAAVFGLVLGLGVLTKPQIWFLLVPLAVAMLLEISRRKTRMHRIFLLLVLLMAICLAVAGWSLVRNQMLNESVFYSYQPSYDPHPATTLTEFLWTYENRLTDPLLRGYWGLFGWVDTHMPQWSYYYLRLATFTALLGIGAYAGNVWARRCFTDTHLSLLIQGAYAATLVIAFAILGFWHYRNIGGIQPSQGRYFLAPVVSQMTLLAVGLLALVPSRWHRPAHLALQAGMILVNIVALFGALIPRYYVP
jgi:4-amino-4-deoxy-L-arabinose transferase-like glycosyltransferase